MACGNDSASGRTPKRHNLGVVRRRTDGRNNLRGAKSSFGQSGYSAQEGCLPAWYRAKTRRGPTPPRRSLAGAWLWFPTAEQVHLRPPSRRRLTCQAPDHGPIRGGRSAEAAMFTRPRCQSVWRRPMGCGAGGQVTTGHLAPQWRAPHGLPLGFCERTE